MNDKDLLDLASQARLEAYAPYSNYRVGAAILCEDGRVFTGANIENAVYGLSICAERVALGKAVSEGCRSFIAIAVTADSPEPCTPCGSCRQVLAEFGPNTHVIMGNKQGDILKSTVYELLPHAFTNKQLKNN